MRETDPTRQAAVTAAVAAIDLLQREIADPETQWSLGTFGAIAEFSRDPDEPVRLTQSDDAVSAVTPRGGIALKPHRGSRPFASESITKSGWNQSIALCLPAKDCAMNGRNVLDGNRRRPRGAARRKTANPSCSISASAPCRRISACGSRIAILAARLRGFAGAPCSRPIIRQWG